MHFLCCNLSLSLCQYTGRWVTRDNKNQCKCEQQGGGMEDEPSPPPTSVSLHVLKEQKYHYPDWCTLSGLCITPLNCCRVIPATFPQFWKSWAWIRVWRWGVGVNLECDNGRKFVSVCLQSIELRKCVCMLNIVHVHFTTEVNHLGPSGSLNRSVRTSYHAQSGECIRG